MRYLLLLLLLLSACTSQGQPQAPERTYIITGVGSYHRHEVHPKLGARGVWRSGVEVQAVYRPTLPIFAPGDEHVSARAPDPEYGAFELDIAIPIR